jgi:hypothetical protein
MTSSEAQQPNEVAADSLAVIEMSSLDDISGGAINWRYHYYNWGMKLAGADPANIASWFIQ